MNNENEQHKAEEEIAQMARDIGQPLPGDLKKRIMDKVHERARDLTLHVTFTFKYLPQVRYFFVSSAVLLISTLATTTPSCRKRKYA